MKLSGLMEWWCFGLMDLLKRAGFVRCVDGDQGGGGGGEPWYGSAEGMDESTVEVLNGFESRDAAFGALVDSRRPYADRVIAADPELAAHKETLARFDGDAKLAKSYMELRSKMGENPLVPLGEDATDEQKAEFNTRLNTLRGVPESPENYQYEIPDEISKQLDKEQLKARLGQFHEAGYTSEQVQAGLNMFFEEAGYLNEKAAEVHETWKSESAGWMKEQWGDDAEKNHELAKRAMQKMGVLDDLESTGFIHKKGMIDSYFQLAHALSEGKLPDNQDGGGGSFEDQLSALKSSDAYKDPRHPDNAKVMKQIDDLYRSFHGKN